MVRFIITLSFLSVLNACGPDFVTVPDDSVFEASEFAPANVSAGVADPDGVALYWEDRSFSETSFLIERRHADASTDEFVPVGRAAADTGWWADQLVATDTTYEYRVKAIQANVSLGRSDPIEVYIPTYKPELIDEYTLPETYSTFALWVPPSGTSGNAMFAGVVENTRIDYVVITPSGIGTRQPAKVRIGDTAYSYVEHFDFTSKGLLLTGLVRNESGSFMQARFWPFASGNSALLDATKDQTRTIGSVSEQEQPLQALLKEITVQSGGRSLAILQNPESIVANAVISLLRSFYTNSPSNAANFGVCRFDELPGANWCGNYEPEFGLVTALAPVLDQRIFISTNNGNHLLAEPSIENKNVVRQDAFDSAAPTYVEIHGTGAQVWGRRQNGQFDQFKNLLDYRSGSGEPSASRIEPTPDKYQYVAVDSKRQMTISCNEKIEILEGDRVLDLLNIVECPRIARRISSDRIVLLTENNVIKLYDLGPRFNSVEGNAFSNIVETESSDDAGEESSESGGE